MRLLPVPLVDLGDGVDRGVEEIREPVQADVYAFFEKTHKLGPVPFLRLLLLLPPRLLLLLRLRRQLDGIGSVALGAVTVRVGVRVHDERVPFPGFQILNRHDALLRTAGASPHLPAAAAPPTRPLLHRHLHGFAVVRQRGEPRVWLALDGEVLNRRGVGSHLAGDLHGCRVHHCDERLEGNLRDLGPVAGVWIHHPAARPRGGLLSLAKLLGPLLDLRGAVLDGVDGLSVVPTSVLNLGISPIDHALHVKHGGLFAPAHASDLPRPDDLDVPFVSVQILLNRTQDEEKDLGQDAPP